jgi:hypothetical protein
VHIGRCFFRIGAFIAISLLSSIAVCAADLKPEEIVARHLDSIAPAENRAAVKSRVVQGILKFRVPVGGAGEVTGTWGRVSAERMSSFVMRFGVGSWRGEQFTFDGSKTGFAAATATHERSGFAQFINSQDFMIKEGLLGGELSTGWGLQDLQANHARVENTGRKKIDGKELVGLQYFSKGTRDMQVKMYFDPANYHHVLTIYSMDIAPNMSSDVTKSSSQKETRYTLEERFGDFQTTEGMTLPTQYGLQWTEELQNGTTRVYDWEMTVKQQRDNVSLDPANFHVK